MTRLAPVLEAFFTQRLMHQRRVSPNTIAAYRDTFRLLLNHCHQQLRIAPAELDLGDLDAAVISGFLDHLETNRHNSVRSRNARLAAIRSFYRYAAYREPGHAELIARVLAIPVKRHERRIVTHLADPEVDALLDACDTDSWIGLRDHTLLAVMIQTGLRVSETITLRWADTHLGIGPHVACHGKGRKDRVTPLTTPTAELLRRWRQHHPDPSDDNTVFVTRHGGPFSRDAVERLITKHAATASRHCTTLTTKRVTPHVLRHTCAMRLLHAGIDTAVIALWLGHESAETTQIYLHADLALKQRAIDRATPIKGASGTYHPPDELLAFLEQL